jgi:hypothetical protein
MGDLKAVRQQWRQDMVQMFDHAKEEQLKRIDRIEEEAWRAWDRSCRTFRTKPRLRLDSNEVEVVNTQAGDPRFLDLARKCCEDRRKLLGLDEPEKIDIKGQVVVASVQLQQAIETNGEYIEYRRQLAFGRSPVARLPSPNDEQWPVAGSTALEPVGYPVGANGNGQSTVARTAVARPRNRLAPSGNGQAN